MCIRKKNIKKLSCKGHNHYPRHDRCHCGYDPLHNRAGHGDSYRSCQLHALPSDAQLD